MRYYSLYSQLCGTADSGPFGTARRTVRFTSTASANEVGVASWIERRTTERPTGTMENHCG
jgi:hypothetical protein